MKLPNLKRAKVFYLIAAAFIVSFALIYLRGYNPALRSLLEPVNADLDNIQTAVQRSLTGDPLAILTVITAPLGVIAAIIKLGTGKINTTVQDAATAKAQVEGKLVEANNQVSVTQEKLDETNNKLSVSTDNLSKINLQLQERTNELLAVKEENARLKAELLRINAALEA